MNQDLPSQLRSLALAAVERVQAAGRGIEPFRGIAIYDTAKDEVFTSLDTFGPAESSIAALPLVPERYGDDAVTRITLQFVYELLDRLSEPAFDEHVCESLWRDFLAELQEPDWICRGVANVRWFTADGGPYDFGAGVSIRGRSFAELAELGFDDFVLGALSDDWQGFGSSSYVIVAERRVRKSPDNLILVNIGTEWTDAQRVLRALRLLSPGDINVSRMWMTRLARFNVGLGSHRTVGVSIPTLGGSTYHLTEAVASRVPEMYRSLQHLEEHGYGAAPGNLDLALRAFMATYDRWPLAPIPFT